MRVVLADDSVLFREGLARILVDAGVTVVAQAGDGISLVDAVRAEAPDLAIIDLRMPPSHSTEGIDAAFAIRGVAPDVGLLLLSQHLEAHHALRLMTDFAGGVGYLLKDRVTDLAGFVMDARRVAGGEVVIDPELIARLVARRREHDPLEALTARELEVLALMARGLSNSALGQELFVSPKTVEAHVRSIFLKLDLHLDDREHRRVRAVLAFLRS